MYFLILAVLTLFYDFLDQIYEFLLSNLVSRSLSYGKGGYVQKSFKNLKMHEKKIKKITKFDEYSEHKKVHHCSLDPIKSQTWENTF